MPEGKRVMGASIGVIVAGAAIGAVAFWNPSATADKGEGGGSLPLPTNIDNFFQPGTQPDPTGLEFDPMITIVDGGCALCHADYDESEVNPEGEPYRHWVGSMMGQAARDPVFYACLTIANQDAGDAGEMCIRCHSPGGWLAGKSVPTDGSALTDEVSLEGVSCHFCHRLVDPLYVEGVSPDEDEAILDALAMAGNLPPADPGTGRYVIDPLDVRRGPLLGPDEPGSDVPYNPHFGFFGYTPEMIFSEFHLSSRLCGTCHDVSNPVLTRQKDGTYLPNESGVPHATFDKADMFPVERTYSEWTQSDFANGGVQMNGRFGGNHPTGVMASCQDCHMPDQASRGCRVPGFIDRPDVPQHAFNGGNTWVLNAIHDLYGEAETGLTEEILSDSIARATQMLRDASDMELSVEEGQLKVRVINFSGHKLPTGYPEGRRMWLNVKFLNDAEELVAEHGAYDFDTAELTTGDTKVYEAKLGIDAAMSALTGLPQGESFHFVLNNYYLLDNRIPPMGFTNAGFETIQASPVNYTYADGQHWDDTMYAIPAGATNAVVTLYFQLTSKEYIEFLRDENVTDDRGQVAYDQWVAQGKSAPVDMDTMAIDLVETILGDFNGDGVVDTIDLLDLLGAWGMCKGCPQDLNGDNVVDTIDLLTLLGNWG